MQGCKDRDVELVVEASLNSGRAPPGNALLSHCQSTISQTRRSDCLISRRLFVDIVEHRPLCDDGCWRRSFILLLRHNVRPIRFVFRDFILLALALFKRLD